jgi:pyrroloquinoline quinone biosynthesis protein D
VITLDARPRLRRAVRLRHDRVRARWLLLAPERGFVLNDSAAAIVRSLVDGGTLAEIAARVASPSEAVAFVQTLAGRGLVEAAS